MYHYGNSRTQIRLGEGSSRVAELQCLEFFFLSAYLRWRNVRSNRRLRWLNPQQSLVRGKNEDEIDAIFVSPSMLTVLLSPCRTWNTFFDQLPVLQPIPCCRPAFAVFLLHTSGTTPRINLPATPANQHLLLLLQCFPVFLHQHYTHWIVLAFMPWTVNDLLARSPLIVFARSAPALSYDWSFGFMNICLYLTWYCCYVPVNLTACFEPDDETTSSSVLSVCKKVRFYFTLCRSWVQTVVFTVSALLLPGKNLWGSKLF